MHWAQGKLPECNKLQPMAEEDPRRTPKGGVGAIRRSIGKQHHNITAQKKLAMTKHISRMKISLPNMLAITGGGSVEDRKKVKKNHKLAPDTTHGTISHDRLATAMLSSARTCYVLPRICMQKKQSSTWANNFQFCFVK